MWWGNIYPGENSYSPEGKQTRRKKKKYQKEEYNEDGKSENLVSKKESVDRFLTHTLAVDTDFTII